MTTEEFRNLLPAYEISLSIQHNEHKSCYETVEEYISGSCVPQFESPEARQQCIDTGELWEMQWYPSTPIGFHRVAAPTLLDLLRYAHSYAK